MQRRSATPRRPRWARTGRAFPRRGAVVVELLINLPVWLIGLLAILEFGEMVGNAQLATMASRNGAEFASQTTGLPTTNSVPVPPTILAVVQSQLVAGGVLQNPETTPWNVFLEHNVAPGGGTLPSPVVLRAGPGAIAPPATFPPPSPSGPSPTPIRYVRVTVSIPTTSLAPNVLKTFGLDISMSNVNESTTYQYEL